MSSFEQTKSAELTVCHLLSLFLSVALLFMFFHTSPPFTLCADETEAFNIPLGHFEYLVMPFG